MNVLVGCEYSGAVRDEFTRRGHTAVSCDLLASTAPGGLHYQGDLLTLLFPELRRYSLGESGPAATQFALITQYEGDVLSTLLNSFYGMRDNPKALTNTDRCILSLEWDLALVHPPCTYLCSSGLHWNERVPGRAELTEEALRFVATLWAAPVGYMGLENPVGCISTRLPHLPAPQYVQPYEYGSNASKKTGLWLRGLQRLKPTQYVAPRRVESGPFAGKARWANQTDSGQNNTPGGTKGKKSATQWKLRSTTYAGIAAAMAQQWAG